MLLWDEVAAEVAKDFPDVKWDKMLVDAMTVRMVQKPKTLDTIVTTNLHGECVWLTTMQIGWLTHSILSDLAASVSGSIGIAHSSSLDPTRQNPSLFEPVHGAAFDIMGKNLANPIAAILSAAEMLRWLGEEAAAELVEKACRESIEKKEVTADLGGTLGTTEVTQVVCKLIQGY